MRRYRKYNKRYRRKRRYYRGKRKTFNSRVRRVVGKLAEKKYFDISVSAAVGTSGIAIRICDSLAVGTNRTERIGNKIFVRYIMPRLTISSENEDGIWVRVAMVKNKFGSYTIADLPVGSGAVDDFIDIQKFNIMSDNTYSLGDADTNGMNKVLYRKCFRVMKPVAYATQASGTQVTNIFNLYVWTNDVITTGQNVVGNIRVYFTDM